MVPYKVTILEKQKSFLVEGDFNPDAQPINIPLKDADRQNLIDYFLHIRDLDEAFAFLQFISIDKPDMMNKALFIAGLNGAMKIFKTSKARMKILKDEFVKQFPALSDELKYFESLRDKHYMHDENGMIETTAFLLLNPEGSPEKFGGLPSVVWNSAHLNYYVESQRLQRFLYSVLDYVKKQIDIIGDQIAKRYAETEWDVLEKFGPPPIKLASTQDVNKDRK